MFMTTGPSGVGGWLAFLIVSLTVLSPLRGLGDTAGNFQRAEKADAGLGEDLRWLHYKQVSWVNMAASAAISIVAGIRLGTIKRRRSVNFAMVALWVIMPASSVIDTVSYLAIYGQGEVASVLPGMMRQDMIAVLSAGLWTGYLLLSKRVRNTYAAD